MSELPASWTKATVGELFRTVGGGTPSTVISEFWQGTIPWISSADIDDGHRLSISRFISEEAVRESAASIVPAGSVIVVTRVGLGKVAITDAPLCFSQDNQALLVADELFDKRYVLYYMSTAVREFKHISRGTTISGVTKKQLLETEFVLPPRKEQTRIVAEIEKQFTRLDAATSALKRVQANLKRYRASVLKAACEGRLVPTEAELARKEGRDYEPADKLLQRILRERRSRWEIDTLAKMITSGKPPKDDRWKEKYKEPVTPDLTNLPRLPEGWCWAAADQVCVQITDGEHIQPPYREEGRPLLTAKHVQNERIDFRDFGLIDEVDFVKARLRCAPQENDVLIVSVGATTGRAGIVRQETPFAIVRSVLLLRPLVNPLFFLTWVQSPWCQDWTGFASGSTAQAHFYIGDAKRMPFPLAPASEQVAITQRRDQVISALDVLEGDIRSKIQSSGALRRSVLDAAFSGKLVAQDPTDETASTLLDRIRAERVSAAPRKSRTRRQEEPTYA